MKQNAGMFRLFTGVILLLLIHPWDVNCQQEQQQQQQTQRERARNSQWFEENIDDFLRQVQDTGEATDIQVSTCKITSQQLVATAHATAARVLKGVCNPSEIEDRFHNLGVQLGDQFNVLKSMVLSLEEKIVEQDQEHKRQFRRLVGMMAGMKKNGGNGGGSTVVDNSPAHTSAYIPTVSHRAEEVEADEESTDLESGGLSTKSGQVGPRSKEMTTYNSTVHIENGKRVFSYYWIVTGMSYKLANWHQKRVMRSNSFYIYPQGYRMYLKIIPRYTTSSMYIHAGITKGDYDDGLEWPFQFKMRAQVLSQNESNGKPTDLRSRIWDPKELCSGSNWRKPVGEDNQECVGLGFPHDVINVPEYIWNDRIIIKLTVYLD